MNFSIHYGHPVNTYKEVFKPIQATTMKTRTVHRWIILLLAGSLFSSPVYPQSTFFKEYGKITGKLPRR